MWGLSGHPWGDSIPSVRGLLPRFQTKAAIVSLLHPAGYATRQCWWHGSSCQRSCSTCQSWSWSRGGWGRDWYFGGGRRSGRVLDDFGACWIYSKHIKIHQRQQLVKPEVSSFSIHGPNPRTLLQKPPCEGQWHIFSAGFTRPGPPSWDHHLISQEFSQRRCHRFKQKLKLGASRSWGIDWMAWCFCLWFVDPGDAWLISCTWFARRTAVKIRDLHGRGTASGRTWGVGAAREVG